ncbi:cysteine/serine-rich nuclear protein 1 isoform X1 [Rhinatrema bivittatum]|uniref:cysteine/serine-rich nuclear protein 1 isoform X1 n=2 Tax=Rhinatrema bivittatum TaxID=194408 RepID=UPI001125B53E|nr:cysteine/serine-rich nuclear protein 1 isoform X1 [Rhinatrema bivittatum]XP_029444248.1 cysteine/serine-rich nuclear protein 1 isoform X1 [Rhinatrema bivittatum]
MSGMLKRKYDVLEDDSTYSSSSSSSSSSPFSSLVASSGWESDEENSREETKPRAALISSDFIPRSILKKVKRLRRNPVGFDRVTVFYFPRCQGFTSVPSRGGCTLGMVSRHSSHREFTLEEYAKEQERAHREKLKERIKEGKLEALKWKLTMNGTRECEEAERLTTDDISDEDIDVSSVDVEDGFFLQPYPAKKRRALLRAVGVKKIDKEEKRELNTIRLSREDCGCSCQEFCEPETCSCSLAGIKCQMDHTSFPCGCTKDGCGNTEGRIEFNQARVQTHHIHTIMKLELEEKQQSSEREMGVAEPEVLSQEQLQPFGCPVGKGALEERAATLAPAFQFSMDLETSGENSCSSDMTDSSASSGQSEDSEEQDEAVLSDKSQSDIDDDGLARILHFNDSENEESSSDCQDNLSYFHPEDFFCDNLGSQCISSVGRLGLDSYSSHLSNISECLDENANQDASCFLDGLTTYMSSSTDLYSKSYTDLGLSADSLDFFQSFSDYNLGPLYNSLKEYENLDNLALHFQLPNLPGFSPVGDPGSCFLESLMGLSESVPETPAPFTDNQLLEDAIKSSLIETVKV